MRGPGCLSGMRLGACRRVSAAARIGPLALLLAATLLPLLPSKKSLSSPVPSPGGTPLTGTWHAALVPTPEYPVLFDVRIVAKGKGLAAFLVNGAVEVPFTSVLWDGTTLTLELAHYDARIVATRAGGELAGRYLRTVVSGVADVPFRASRTPPPLPPAPPAGRTAAGAWGFEVAAPNGGIDRLLGTFVQRGAALTGTLASVTGDQGPLHGWFDGERLLLTVFDGVHVYRYDGELLPDGTLAGEHRSRTAPPVSWRARRLDEAAAAAYLPAAASVVRAKDPAAPFRFAYPDADGKVVSSGDARFAGKPMVVSITGTWCPNCYDEAPLLRDLLAAYGPKGLEVVSLSFEYTDDAERNRRQVKRFVERHGLRHPVLVAGTTQGARTSEAVRQIEGFLGYPTTLFLDRAHRIVATHSGFDGPATGARHEETKREFEERVKALLR